MHIQKINFNKRNNTNFQSTDIIRNLFQDHISERPCDPEINSGRRKSIVLIANRYNLASDTVTFSAKITPKVAEVDHKHLLQYIGDLIPDYLSYDSSDREKISRVMEYIMPLEDNLKVATIKSAIKHIDKFIETSSNLFEDLGYSQDEAKISMNMMKIDFAFSASTIKDSELKFNTIKEFINHPDKKVKIGATRTISTFDTQKEKDQLIKDLMKKENTFKKGGMLFNQLEFFTRQSSDKLQYELFKNYLDNLDPNDNHVYHEISNEHKIKNILILDKLTKKMVDTNREELQNDIIKIIKKHPKGIDRDNLLKYFVNKQFEQQNHVPFSTTFQPDLVEVIKTSSRETKIEMLYKLHKLLGDDYCLEVIDSI